MRRGVLFVVFFLAVIGFGGWVKTHFFAFQAGPESTSSTSAVVAEPVIVAILDTGIEDGFAQAHSKNFSWTGGWNFSTNSAEPVDRSGHGTTVAEVALGGAQDALPRAASLESSPVQLLPIKITEVEAGVTPKILAEAIRFAVQKQAKVINLSFGLTETSPELRDAMSEAEAKHVIVVTAAGSGIVNPYDPISLEKVFPQSYPNAIVVGVARRAGSGVEPEKLSNFGEALDFVLISSRDDGNFSDDRPKSYGSSFAAARTSGALAVYLSEHRDLSPETARSTLRALAAGASDHMAVNRDRLGFGVLNVSGLAAREPIHTSDLVLKNPGGPWVIELNSDAEIASATANCGTSTFVTRPKDRGRLTFSSPPDPACTLSIDVKNQAGSTVTLTEKRL